MINPEKFKLNFNNYEVPTELISLLEFQNNLEKNPDLVRNGYSDGFWLVEDGRSRLEGYCSNNKQTQLLFPFAKADSSGSLYVLWNKDQSKNLSTIPIVVFGSEGGEFVVTENILQLMEILTFDVEPAIYQDDGISFKKSENYKSSEGNKKYRAWVKIKYDISAAINPTEIIQTAQEKYQELFTNWIKK